MRAVRQWSRNKHGALEIALVIRGDDGQSRPEGSAGRRRCRLRAMEGPDVDASALRLPADERGGDVRRFVVQDRVDLHRAYAGAGPRDVLRLFADQIAMLCQSQAKTRAEMIQIAVDSVRDFAFDDLRAILRDAVGRQVASDFSRCRAAMHNRHVAADLLGHLTVATNDALISALGSWMSARQDPGIIEHARRMLHSNVEKLAGRQRRLALKATESCSLGAPPVDTLGLPDAVWQRVLAFAGYRAVLGSLRRVNRHLFRVVHDDGGWWLAVQDFAVHWFWIPVFEEDLPALFSRLRSLRSAAGFPDPGLLTGQIVSLLSQHCPRLERIEFDMWTCLTDDHVEQLARCCPNLRYASLDGCRQLTDRALVGLARSCPGLSSLSLRWCPRISSSSIVSLTVMQNLRHLGLSNSAGVEADALGESAFVNVLRSCSRLESLDFAGRTRLDDRSLRGLAFSNIERLVLADCPSITEQGLETIARSCPRLLTLDVSRCAIKSFPDDTSVLTKLVTLSMSGCPKIGDAAVHSISRYQALTNVDLSGCALVTDDGIAALARGCRRVRCLSVNGCTLLTDKALQAIASGMPLLEDISFANLRLVGNDGVHALSTNLSYLISLNASGCSRVTDVGLHSLSSSESASRVRHLNLHMLRSITKLSMESLNSLSCLESLNIGGCCAISYEGFMVLCASRFRSRLRELNISKCPAVDDDTVKLVAMCLTSLVELDLSMCSRVTDRSLKSIAAESSSIRRLLLMRCRGISSAGLNAIARSEMQLRFLDVSGCPGVSLNAIQRMQSSCPALRIVCSTSDACPDVSPSRIYRIALERASTR